MPLNVSCPSDSNSAFTDPRLFLSSSSLAFVLKASSSSPRSVSLFSYCLYQSSPQAESINSVVSNASICCFIILPSTFLNALYCCIAQFLYCSSGIACKYPNFLAVLQSDTVNNLILLIILFSTLCISSAHSVVMLSNSLNIFSNIKHFPPSLFCFSPAVSASIPILSKLSTKSKMYGASFPADIPLPICCMNTLIDSVPLNIEMLSILSK